MNYQMEKILFHYPDFYAKACMFPILWHGKQTLAIIGKSRRISDDI